MTEPASPRRALRRRARGVLGAALAVSALAAACHRSSATRPNTVALPAVEWPAALGDAQRAAIAGRYEDAERTLTTFAETYAGSPEASEVLFWRAVLQLDPANQGGSTEVAARTLDAYLALDPIQHRLQAGLLRRVAALVVALSAGLQAAKSVPPPVAPPPAALKEKDDEILRLRDSLTKTSAELERVRKRLAPKN